MAEAEESRRTNSAADLSRRVCSLRHSRTSETVILASSFKTVIFQLLLFSALLQEIIPPAPTGRVQALRITNFYVPPYVPITLPTNGPRLHQPGLTGTGAPSNQQGQQQLDLAKPILFDCDYEYKPQEDVKLTVRWFRNKEAEPFYQWLPELNERHFADWIRPLVNDSFVSDPYDPLKRYRSILIKRLSMNLTGQYSCLVSSLAGQDARQSSLIVYKPPSSFAFEHRISSASAATGLLQTIGNPSDSNQQQKMIRQDGVAGARLPAHNASASSPTQFKGWNQPSLIVRPANNHNIMAAAGANLSQHTPPPPSPNNTKIVYTHDGRPIRRKSKRQSSPSAPQISDWMLRQRLQLAQATPVEQNDLSLSSISGANRIDSGHHNHNNRPTAAGSPQTITNQNQQSQKFAIQLHHFKCQADQITPRPVMVLTVKRDADSIAQYLHESSSLSIRPYQVSQADYYHRPRASSEQFAQQGRYDLNPSLRGDHIRTRRPTTRNAAEEEEEEDDNALDDSQSRGEPEGPKEANDQNKFNNDTSAFTYSRQLQQFFPPVTLYNITVSAIVALNVSLGNLAPSQPLLAPLSTVWPATSGQSQYLGRAEQLQQQLLPGINTVLPFRRGQRMSFECHLEITGTEYEDIKRININEEEVYQFAEAMIQQQQKRPKGNQQATRSDIYGTSSRFGLNLDSSRATKSVDAQNLSLTISLLILSLFFIS